MRGREQLLVGSGPFERLLSGHFQSFASAGTGGPRNGPNVADGSTTTGQRASAADRSTTHHCHPSSNDSFSLLSLRSIPFASTPAVGHFPPLVRCSFAATCGKPCTHPTTAVIPEFGLQPRTCCIQL